MRKHFVPGNATGPRTHNVPLTLSFLHKSSRNGLSIPHPQTMTARPSTLREIAEQADSLTAFGQLFRDWLHTLRGHSSRPTLALATREEPPLLASRFTQGDVADAWLAAYAELIAQKIQHPAPAWTHSPARTLAEPWFASPDASQPRRLAALRDSPPPFKNRNLFTESVDLPLTLRAGRPRTTADAKRRTNAERQRRFRAHRALELELLRTVALHS
jgi:hypothetical protein